MSFLRLLDYSMWNCFCCEQAEMQAPPGQNHGQPQSQCNTSSTTSTSSSSPRHAFLLPMAAPTTHLAMTPMHARKPPGPPMITAGSSSAAGTVACPDAEEGMMPNLRVFTFAELKVATRNFKPDNVLGEGGFGRVYKGWIETATTKASSSAATAIAVKRLNPESSQGLQEWQSEVNFLGRLSHPNLVRLLGYCMEDRELLLVYEFMARGSLENHLFTKEGGSSVQAIPIPWGLRLRIAICAARGLAFLHSSETHVIYGDFKSSNILLDTHYNAKISDFGLAKNGPANGHSHVTTRVMGTLGYAAPEYVSSGHLYLKSDVYGFGVVLLELLTGMRALDTARPAPQVNLVNWAKPYLAGRQKVVQLVDPHLEGQYMYGAAISAAQLILSCLSDDPRNRPSMAEVVAALENIQRMKPPPPPHGRGSAVRSVHGHTHAPLRQGGRV